MAWFSYQSVPDADSTEDLQTGSEINSRASYQVQVTVKNRRRYAHIVFFISTFCILLSITSIYTIFFPVSDIYQSSTTSPAQHQAAACKTPALRQEWRTLSIQQKRDYISAVQCLQTRPSKLGMDHTLHDEFTWLHSRLGNFTHETSAFSAWHRYFLHVYETTLQEECGFKGHLTYWDWTLDVDDMANSPVWDIDTGFGGNGNENAAESVGRGHCVTDGPFANLTVQYFSSTREPHCLSRGFLSGEILNHRFSDRVHPQLIESLLEEPEYDVFNSRLEAGPHDAVPRGVNGDFSRETAPNDPVFFLHHTSLDRMWWKWQQRDPQRRLWAYGSNVAEYSLDDVFHFGGFAPDKKVKELMSTESEFLCYTY